jgi:hypothetical protein
MRRSEINRKVENMGLSIGSAISIKNCRRDVRILSGSIKRGDIVSSYNEETKTLEYLVCWTVNTKDSNKTLLKKLI